MSNPAKQVEHDSREFTEPVRSTPVARTRTLSSQCVATVRAISEDGIIVDDGGLARLVRQATSCLIEPEVGDVVLLAVPGNDAGGYLLAVLERESSKTTLSVPGDLVLAAPRGRMSLRAGEGLELVSPKDLELRADEVRVQARSGRLFLDECAAIVRTMFASLTKVTHVGEVFELLVDRFTQRSKHSTRAIEGLDHTSAQNLDYKVENNVHVHATRTVVNGREIVKIDGGQIHLG
jgi:hypothetical protein